MKTNHNKTMNKQTEIYIPYILSLDNLGYIQENKLLKSYPIDQLPVIGEKITTFYDEEFIFYNISASSHTTENHIIQNKQLVPISQEEARSKIIPLLVQFVGLIEHVDCIDLHGVRNPFDIHDKSHFQTLKNSIERIFYVKIENTPKTDFSLIEFQKIENELFLYKHLDISLMHNLVGSMLRGVNTLLARDNIIPCDFNNSMLFCIDHDDETNDSFLSYGQASYHTNKIEDYSVGHFNLPKKAKKLV